MPEQDPSKLSNETAPRKDAERGEAPPTSTAPGSPSRPLDGMALQHERNQKLLGLWRRPLVWDDAAREKQAKEDASAHWAKNDGHTEDPAAHLVGDGKSAGQRIDEWVKDGLAELRVANGLADSYYLDLKHDLEKTLGKKLRPSDLDVRRAEDALAKATKEYLTTAANYGRTGTIAPLGMQLGTQDEGFDPQHFAMNAGLSRDQGERINRLIEDAYGSELTAIVDITQNGLGEIEHAELLKSSGSRVFDQEILTSFTQSVTEVEIPDHLRAAYPTGRRSVWEVHGKLVLRKKARDVHADNAAQALKIAAGVPLTLLTGMPFEETTGDVWLYDFDHPTAECRARLLRLY